MYYIYAIHNPVANKFYIGQTNNLSRRLEWHGNGEFSNSYTAKFSGEWKLVYKEECLDRATAIKREKQLKSFRGREFIKSQILSA